MRLRKKVYQSLLLSSFSGLILFAALFFLFFCSGSFQPAGVIALVIATFAAAALFLFLFCHWNAKRLTNTITRSINTANLEKGYIAYDELSPFVRQVRDQKTLLDEQLAEVAKESALLDALSKSMNEGLILVDQNGKVLSINRSACTMLGVNDNSVGKNILESFRRADVLKHLNLAIRGQSSEFIFELSSRTYQILFSPVDHGALILLLDITEKAESEKMREEFSANVSHELKTPLTIIKGFAELIENGMVKSEDITGMASKIKNESDRLIILIKDIIKLSQLDEGVGAKNFTETDLCEVAREAAESLRERASNAGITIDTACGGLVIPADRDMMYEMFYNLIDNSVKYNKPGGKVTVYMSREREKVCITVSDTGIGIEAKHLSRIFERFYRVDPSRSKKTGGTGLGLSIVKHIIVFHNGTISIESKLGIGTTISISLNAVLNEK